MNLLNSFFRALAIMGKNHEYFVLMFVFMFIGFFMGNVVKNTAVGLDRAPAFMIIVGMVYGLSEGRKIYKDWFN